MPSEADHIALANKNHQALHCLHDAGQHPEWVVTIAFYKAVQVVQAMFAKTGRKCHDHKSRHYILYILKTIYPGIWKHYRPLWQASTIARYLHDNVTHTTYTDFGDHCPADRVYSRFVEKRLRSVEELSVGQLTSPLAQTLLRIP